MLGDVAAGRQRAALLVPIGFVQFGKLGEREKPLVFLFWGGPAKKKSVLIDTSRHPILSSPHPSPLSASTGFFGSRPFSQINALLRDMNEPEIDWRLDPL